MDLKKAYDIALSQQNRYASQRLTSYHYSLILFGLLINALISLWSKAFAENAPIVYAILAVLISLVIIILSFLFYGVDARTLTFLNAIEDLLIKYEAALINGETTTDLLYFTNEKRIRRAFDKDKTPFYQITKKKFAGFFRAFVRPKLGSLIHFTYVAFWILGFVSIGISVYFLF